MFRVAVVGCGGIGMLHAKAWKTVEGTELIGVADLNPKKAKAAGEALGVPYYTDAGKIKDLDAVSVVTPPHAHYAVVKPFLDAGISVFCEKPLTVVPAQAFELAKTARDNGLQLGVGFKMRYEPAWKAAKEHIGEIGKIISVVTTKQQAFNPRPEGAWVKKTGAMYELSIHDFDLIGFITGSQPDKVLYAKLGHRFGWEAEDAYHIVADCEGAFTANLQGMYAVSSTFCYRDLTMTFLGDKGYMRVERPDRIVIHTDTYRVIEINVEMPNTFALELADFKAACEGKMKNPVNAEKAAELTRFIEDARAYK